MGMTRQQVLDLYFLDARHKLIEIAAFLDRVERATGPSSPSASTRLKQSRRSAAKADGKDDFRLKAFRIAVRKLSGRQKAKARRVLLTFSDPTTKPIAKAASKGAVGAWPGKRV
jgi:hypothetical protein